MESWDDKIWADKLNSLQEFPAGYTPDLSSKWEIVEAGLPTNRKWQVVPLILRWSVAAAILLAIGFLWMAINKKEATGLVLQEKTIQPTSPVQKQHAIATSQVAANKPPSLVSHQNLTTATNKKLEPAKEPASQLPPEMATIPVREDTNQGVEDVVLSIDNLSGLATQQTSVSVATILEENPRPAKKKIYQRDFNDGALVMDTGFVPSSRQHFSIQLNPFSRKTNDGEPPARRLQLKQAL